MKKDLDKMTKGFCAEFHKCADIIIKNPDMIPAGYVGNESAYIGKECMKYVANITKRDN